MVWEDTTVPQVWREGTDCCAARFIEWNKCRGAP